MNNQNHIQKHQIWTPHVAARWSVIFTPLFGAVVQMRNWESLGRTREARQAFFWVLGITVVLSASILSSTVFRETAKIGIIGKYLPWITLLAWYFFSARKQSQYVRTELNGIYEKKGWLKPLLAGTTVMFLVIGVFGFYTSDETSLGFDEGLAFGRSADISACYSKSLNRMQNCSGFKCEMYEIGFAKGCSTTAQSNQAFCQEYPSSVLDAAGKIKEVCQNTRFSEKGCYNSLKSYAAKCLNAAK